MSQKFDIGFLLVELSLENMFVCVNMYTLRSRRVLAATAAAAAATGDGGATQQLGASTEVQKKYQVGGAAPGRTSCKHALTKRPPRLAHHG